MATLTLIAAPSRRDLGGSAADDLPDGWATGTPRWLAAGEAVELDLAAVPDPDELEAEWERWQRRGIDLVVQPRGPRRHMVLLADMDSTMIEQECIDELAARVGVGERVAGITRRAMEGELDFEAALRERVGLLAGLPLTVVEDVLREDITFTPGGAELLATMRSQGAWAALVSGGFTRFTAPVAERLGFDEHRANTLATADGRLTGEVVPPVVGAEAKLRALREVTAARGLSADDAIAVGDGANDLPMLLAAGTGVALHAKPLTASQASVRVNHGDLTSLLWIQGYRSEEVVRP